MPHALGIDFGTTNSSVSFSSSGIPTSIPVDEYASENRIMKSVLYVNPRQEITVGTAAINKYLSDVETIPATTPQMVKTGRILTLIKPSTGGGFGGVEKVEEVVEMDTSGRGRLLQSLKSVLSNDLYKGTEIFGKFYSLEELLSIILRSIREKSELFLAQDIDTAVIGRPVRYVGKQGCEALALSRMEKVAQAAGFKEVVFEYEPVGAALNYGVDITSPQNVLIFDFGGGTLDICIMRFPTKEVLAVGGRPIGGDLLSSMLFINRLGRYFGKGSTLNKGANPFPSQYIHSLTNWYSITLLKTRKYLDSLEAISRVTDDAQAVSNLTELIVEDYGYKIYQEVDRAKRCLSDTYQDKIFFQGKTFIINESILRKEFEFIIHEQLAETEKLLNETLNSAGLSASDIDHVVTTGGSSSIPIFRNLLTTFFDKEKVLFGECYMSVSRGLAIRAECLFA